jgi:exopolysaccharide biosynthesis polyprenyl glycosylphosphotransferase
MKSTWKERLAVLLVDALSINVAWLVYYVVRVRSGWLEVAVMPEVFAPMAATCLFWVFTFLLVGLYRPWYAASRFDEVTLVFKTLSLGCLFVFFAVFVDDAGNPTGTSTRILIVVYWGILLVCVAGARFALRSFQRHLLVAGIVAHDSLVVGDLRKGRKLMNEVASHPGLGLRVVGFVGLGKRRSGMRVDGVPYLGGVEQLETIIDRVRAREVLVALDSRDHQRLLEIVARCGGRNVGIKIIPDLYDIISGQARTNQIYGFPLIDISPQLMAPWEESAKRLLDLLVAVLVLVLGFPVWLLVALSIKMESDGPVLYVQERVGKDGDLYSMVKFRSMRNDAEKAGPKWADKRDSRVTRVGRILRQLHLDEIPQFWNVLNGDMSLVGPRPERLVFVEQLSKQIPLYRRRLKVRPGITGWAQVKHKYDESIEDVRKKIQYDLFYIENMSLRMDFKIILSTFSHMLMWKGH